MPNSDVVIPLLAPPPTPFSKTFTTNEWIAIVYAAFASSASVFVWSNLDLDMNIGLVTFLLIGSVIANTLFQGSAFKEIYKEAKESPKEKVSAKAYAPFALQIIPSLIGNSSLYFTAWNGIERRVTTP